MDGRSRDSGCRSWKPPKGQTCDRLVDEQIKQTQDLLSAWTDPLPPFDEQRVEG